ncbi:MAG: hypothetical protein EX271_04170, partial [Acidimicrobiales bacterium]
GSTAKYADRIGVATGLPVFSIEDSYADPTKYDFLVLGSSVIVYKLTIRKWVTQNLAKIANKPIILFSVSGAGPGAKLDKWVADCLPKTLVSSMQHVGLRGRLDMNEISWWLKLFMRIGSWKSDDPEVKKHELEGFDFMDESSISPVVEMVEKIQSSRDLAA